MQEVRYKLQICHNIVRKYLENYKLNNKRRYDKNINPINLEIMDKVLLRDNAAHKLEPMFKGPYQIKEINNTNAEIEDCTTGKCLTVHKNRLVKYTQT